MLSPKNLSIQAGQQDGCDSTESYPHRTRRVLNELAEHAPLSKPRDPHAHAVRVL